MSWIDELTVDGGLTAHHLEPDALKGGRRQRIPVEGIVASLGGLAGFSVGSN
jgi:hypothetical protein